MKKLIVLAVASVFATSAVAAEMKWSGSAGWRYSQTSYDDKLNSVNTVTGGNNLTGKSVSKQSTKDHSIRANLGVTGGWENVEWGVGVRTTGNTGRSATTTNGTAHTFGIGAAGANDDYRTLNNSGDAALGFEQAWFRYVRDFGSTDFSLTIGRQKNVFAYDMDGQSLFDNDVRWDGFGWNFKFGMFGLNAAQYITGARSSGSTGASAYTRTESSDAVASTASKMFWMWGIQPYMNWKFSDDIDAMFAVGYFGWNDEQNTNGTGGGWNSNGLNSSTTGSIPALAAGSFRIHNPRQWQFLANVTLPYNLTFTGEYVMNAKNKAAYNGGTLGTGYTGTGGAGGVAGSTKPAVGKTAMSLGLKYGKLAKAHDFTVGYAYGSKGIASVIGAYSNDRFLPDNKGHTFQVGYAIADNFHLGWKGIFLTEKEKLSPVTGGTYGAVAAAGTNANQEQKTKYWELTTGVMF